MCSLRASPLPTPRVNRPFSRTAEVAAAWAITAGWTRTVGQVTAVVTGRLHACEMAPITDHTNALCPCSSFHGWKWSLTHSASKPASSASRACSTSSAGVYSSVDRKYPSFTSSLFLEYAGQPRSRRACGDPPTTLPGLH